MALVLVGVVHAVGMAVWPNYGNDDEGTYMARAWAVQTGLGAHHGPAPYTYWYDHPPFGWIQLSLWTWLTHTFRAGTIAVASGRADMLLYTLVCAVLVYVVARRLGCSIPVATGAMLLFGLSPLSVQNMRMVMLDTIGLPWVLGAFALALSPRRRLWAYTTSGLCFAAGVLSKETYLLLLPALAWQIWQRAEGPTRRMCLCVFSSVTLGTLFFYPLYALLKGELLPGQGHVSLIGAIEWQLYGRTGSGSPFTAGTAANQLVLGWLHTDPWLLVLGTVALPVTLVVRHLRPIGLALATLLAVLIRPGYLPAAYITGALPFAALTAAGAVDAAWRCDLKACVRLARIAKGFRNGLPWARRLGSREFPTTLFPRVLVVALTVSVAVVLVPQWASGDHHAMTTDTTIAFRQAETWINAHVPRSATLLVDDNVWIDLVDDGYRSDNVVWFWELDLDPQVRRVSQIDGAKWTMSLQLAPYVRTSDLRQIRPFSRHLSTPERWLIFRRAAPTGWRSTRSSPVIQDPRPVGCLAMTLSNPRTREDEHDFRASLLKSRSSRGTARQR